MTILGALSDTHRISLYIRVARAMTERIQRGEWKVGAAIPTIEELCGHFAVSRNTMRQALEMLTNSGLIASSRGRPTIVQASRSSHLDDPKRLHAAINDPSASIDIKILSRKTVRAPPPQLAADFALFESYVWYRKVHNLGKRPYVLADFYVATEVADKFERGSERRSKIDLLLQQQKTALVASKRQFISTAHADEIDSKIMGCDMGETIVDVKRWWEDDLGRLICGALSKYRADTFVFEVIDRKSETQD